MNEAWQALAREAGIAAEHLVIGASALGKVSYASHAYYNQAFFALTVGFERSTKLALVVDHSLVHGGSFPSHRVLRSYGHDIRKLLDQNDEIAERRGLSEDGRLPRSGIHNGIIKVLSDFASNITRYYNMDLVTGDPRTVRYDSPIRAWFEHVINPVLATHYRPHHRQKHEGEAKLVEELLGGHVMLRHHSETGELLDSLYDARLQILITNFAKPYTRMYVMQIARFIANLLSELGYAAHGVSLDIIPHFSEFFGIFLNSDAYFKKRKTWSIHRT